MNAEENKTTEEDKNNNYAINLTNKPIIKEETDILTNQEEETLPDQSPSHLVPRRCIQDEEDSDYDPEEREISVQISPGVEYYKNKVEIGQSTEEDRKDFNKKPSKKTLKQFEEQYSI